MTRLCVTARTGCIFVLLAMLVPGFATAETERFARDYPLGMAAAREGRLKDAIQLWRGILQEGSPDASEQARLWYAIARTFRKGGSEARAVKAARRALRFAPGNTKLEAFLATSPGEDDEVSDVSPRTGSSEGDAGRSFAERFAEARESFAVALESDDSIAGSAEGSFDGLAPFFREAVSKGVEKAFSLYALGTCIVETNGDAAEARKHLEAALAAGCTEKLLRFRLGELLLVEGKAKEAVPHLEAAVPCSPYKGDAAAALLRALALSGGATDGGRVRQLVKMVADVDPMKLEGTVELIADPDVRREAEASLAESRRARQQAAAEEQKAEAEAQKADAEEAAKAAKEEQQQEKREKTQQEKGMDTYNAMRYREYLDHLAKLGRGQPSTWSGPIPEAPKKE